MNKQQSNYAIPLNSVVISIEEHEKLLKFREAAQKNMLAFLYGGAYINDSVHVATTDDVILSLKKVIELQEAHIEKVDKALRDANSKIFELDPKNNINHLCPGGSNAPKKLKLFDAFSNLLKK